MRYLSPLLTSITAFALVQTAVAAPASVNGLQAEFREDGNIAVTWDKLEDESVAYYRVYFAANSILENEGEYDDLEQTDGPKGLYVFEGLTPDSDLFVAVLAVNQDGEESEFFAEEIQIHVPAEVTDNGATPEATPVENENTVQQEGTMQNATLQLISAKAVSATEVHAQISLPIDVRSKGSTELFSITNAAGVKLGVVTAVSAEGGKTVVVRTEPQKAGVVYQLRINDAISQQYGVELDEGNITALFTGSADGEVATVTPEVQAPPTPAVVAQDTIEPTAQQPIPNKQEQIMDPNAPPQVIQGLTVLHTTTQSGLHNVSVKWNDAGILKNAAYLVASQSFDGGITFSEPQLVPGNALSIDLQGVPSGQFGLFLQSMNPLGMVSEGAFANVRLGNGQMDTAVPSQPTPAVEVPAPPKEQPLTNTPVSASLTVQSPDMLPESGAGVVLLTLLFGGALLGWKHEELLTRMLQIGR